MTIFIQAKVYLFDKEINTIAVYNGGACQSAELNKGEKNVNSYSNFIHTRTALVLRVFLVRQKEKWNAVISLYGIK